jgi:hypothetical protein
MLNNAELEADAAIASLDEQAMGAELYAQTVASIEAELDEKRKQAAREEAERQKQYAKFTILINTAMALANVWTSGGWEENLIESALVGAEMALQYAAVESANIPGYKDGRIGGPAEFAKLAEGNKAEIVETKDGLFLTPNKETLAFLPENANVYPHMESMQMLGSGLSVQQLKELNGNVMTLISVIENKPDTGFSITERGLLEVQRKQKSRVTFLNKLNS